VYFYCDWYQHGKLLLFSPDSPMYGEAGLKRFEGIADLAVAGDRVVTENLLDFLRLLRAGVEGRISSVSHGTMPAVLGTPGFMRAVWRGATATPLTDTAARLLRDFRVRALKLARVPVEDMPVPAWWSATLKASATADEAVPSESVEHVVAEVEGVEAVTPPIDVPSADAFASGDIESSPQTP
jgi:hypothetical protein